MHTSSLSLSPSFVFGVLFLLIIISTQAQTYADVGTEPAQISSQETSTGNKNIKEYSLSPDKSKKALALSSARYRLYFIGIVYVIFLLLLFIAGRVAVKFRGLAERLSTRRLIQALIFAPLLLLAFSVGRLPLGIYSHYLQLQYDLSIQGWGSWFWDWSKGVAIELILGTILIGVLYYMIRRHARRWWLYCWLMSLPVLVFVIFVTPVLLDPLFNHFEPLSITRPALVPEIEKVVLRSGLVISPERMYEMKASQKVKTLNAYVTGIGATKRVVVWDTASQQLSVQQVLFVFGHELGHYVLGHIYWGLACTAFLLLIFLYLTYLAANWSLQRWGRRWSIREVGDWASLPVLLCLLFKFSFLSDPLANAYSRHLEHEADIYGLEVTHGLIPDSTQNAAETFQKLGESYLEEPNPNRFVTFWLFSHPPISERLKFAREYDPWSTNSSPMFIK